MSAFQTDIPLSVLRKPKFKAMLIPIINRELQAVEARQQAKAAEDQFTAEHGEQASHEAEMAKCKADGVYWLRTWGWTFDPRLVGKPGGAFIRFIPWAKQEELWRWLEDRFAANEPGLIEKSRDQGVTYIVMAFYLHKWLFFEGFKASCTSRSEDAVDQINNPDSMFEKLRIMLRRLPLWMLPAGFSWHHHDLAMRLINPDNGAIITGEAGDDAGRSGRSALYCVDEAAFLANAASVESALSGNTDCVIWMSTVNPQGGMGNFFARKRHSDSFRPDQIFRIHWRDDPRKDDAWASAKKLSLSDPTAWEAEFEINYTAAAEGICIPAAWVAAAQRVVNLETRLHKMNARARRIAGVDVGAGKAKSVYVDRVGPMVGTPQSRGDPDTTGTAHWALDLCKTRGATVLNYDANGPGIGVTSTFASVDREGLQIVPVSTGDSPTEREWPDERTASEIFRNLRAELWWMARGRFQRTYEHVLWLEKKDGGAEHPIEELIALPAPKGEAANLAAQLSLLKWTKNETGKIVIESKESLKKRNIPSPDCFVAGTMIMTPRGEVPIETLKVGDNVLTPFGPTPVIKTWKKDVASITEAAFSNGARLRGTGSHKVFAWGMGQVRLDALPLTVTMETYSFARYLAWKASSLLFTGANASEFRQAVNISTAVEKMSLSAFCIGGFGRTLTALFQRAARFITRTIIGGTTLSPILNASPSAITSGCTSPYASATKKNANPIRQTLRQSGRSLLFGINRKKQNRSTVQPLSVGGQSGAPSKSSATSAAVNSKRPLQRGLSSALETVCSGRLISKIEALDASVRSAAMSLWRTVTGEPSVVPVDVRSENVSPTVVYNLTLLKHNAYYANGILVFNCADALVMTLLEPDDDEALGIFKRNWFRMWPAFNDAGRTEPRTLPEFQFVLVSLRTAFDDERRLEHRGIEPTACGVYGVFNVQQQFDDKERRAFGIITPSDGPKTPRYAALLCDFWYEKLSFADVADRVREIYRQKWGPKGSGKRPDVVIVEETTTDRSMRQTLTEFGVPAWPLARDQSRTMRAHQSAGFVQQGHIFVPESRRPERKGFVCDWAEPMVKQACSFSGRGSTEGTSGLDQMTSAILYLAMKETIKASPTRRPMPDPDEEEERMQREAMRQRDRERRGKDSWYG